LVFERGPITVACNLAQQHHRVPLRAGRNRVCLQSEADVRLESRQVSLPSESVVILKGRL
jgi:hypothetical protein